MTAPEGAAAPMHFPKAMVSSLLWLIKLFTHIPCGRRIPFAATVESNCRSKTADQV